MGERGYRQEGNKVVWDQPDPINDFTVWLKLKREFEEKFNCAFRMKEDDDDNLTVIFDNEAYAGDKAFEQVILDRLAEIFGKEIIHRTAFSYVDKEQFKIII